MSTREQAYTTLARCIHEQVDAGQYKSAMLNAARLIALMGGVAQVDNLIVTKTAAETDMGVGHVADGEDKVRDADREAWERGDTMSYAGYKIVPKRDFGNSHYLINGVKVTHGWVVTDGVCNVIPGATWARTKEQACHLIDVYLAADKDDTKFWHMLRMVKGCKGDYEIVAPTK